MISNRLLIEWDFEKNDFPDGYTKGMNKKVWWICSKNHNWEMSIASREGGKQNCPYCSGKRPTKLNNLKVAFPKICKEWSYKNDQSPENFLPFSGKKMIWQCSYGHEWIATIRDRTKSGSGCHICSGYSKQKKCEISNDGNKKRCNNCNIMKNINSFRKRNSNNKSQWLNSICKQCEKKDVDQYRTMTKEGFVAEIVRRKKYECKKKKLEFDLTKKFVLQRLEDIEWKCELTGLPMRSIKTSLDEKYQGFHLDSVSVDRIHHNKGYTKDNIRFVLNQVNVFRSNGSDSRMYKIAKALLKVKEGKCDEI